MLASYLSVSVSLSLCLSVSVYPPYLSLVVLSLALTLTSHDHARSSPLACTLCVGCSYQLDYLMYVLVSLPTNELRTKSECNESSSASGGLQVAFVLVCIMVGVGTHLHHIVQEAPRELVSRVALAAVVELAAQ